MRSSFKNILLDNSFNFDYPPDICPTPAMNSQVTPKLKNATPQKIVGIEMLIAEKYEIIKNIKQTSKLLSKSLVNHTDHYNHDQQQQYLTMLIDSFKNQIDSLKREVCFFARGNTRKKRYHKISSPNKTCRLKIQ